MAEVFNLTVAKPYTFSVLNHNGWPTNANLLTPQPGEKAVSSNVVGKYVTLDLGSVLPIRQLALLYTDVDSTDVVSWSTSVNADMSAPNMSSGALAMDPDIMSRPAGYRHLIYHLAAAVNARYVRVYLGSTGNKVLTAGIAVVSNPLQLEYNPDFGETSWGYDEADEGDILDSGVEVLQQYAAAPVLNFTATWVTQAEMNAGWEELGRLQWEGQPVMVVRRPDEHTGRHRGIYWGRLRMVPIVAAEFDMFEVQGRIRSMV